MSSFKNVEIGSVSISYMYVPISELWRLQLKAEFVIRYIIIYWEIQMLCDAMNAVASVIIVLLIKQITNNINIIYLLIQLPVGLEKRQRYYTNTS